MKIRSVLFVSIILLIFFSCEKNVSVSPPDKKPPEGSVFIDSYPNKFEIYLNGRYRIRSTPDSLNWLSTGTYEIVLKKELFLDTVFAVDVIDGIRSKTFIDFSKNKKMLGNLFVTSDPEGAGIFINDSSTSQKTPYQFNNLLPSHYRIVLKKDNHLDINKIIAVRSSMTSVFNPVMVDTTIWGFYNIENSGIYTNNLTAVAVDETNIIWLGSRKGVISYDGTNWNIQTPSNSALPHVVVTGIAIDSKNAKWISTISGIGVASKLNVNQQWASRHTNLPTDYFSNVYVKLSSFHDIYYFAADSGIVAYSYDMELKRYVWRMIRIPDVKNFTVVSFYSNLGLLAGSKDDGVVAEIEGWKIFNRYNSNISGNQITSMYESEEGVWIGNLRSTGTSAVLSLYNNGSFKTVKLTDSPPLVQSIFVDKNNLKWIGSDLGIFVFRDFQNKILINESNSGLPLKNIIGIAEDAYGNILFASKENGLFKLKKIERYIQ